MQTNQIINIDWLAYSAYGIVGETTLFNRFKVLPKEHGSQVFKNVASIITNDTLEEVAQMQYNPRSSALKPNLVIVKLANRCLYEYDYVKLIKTINEGLNLEYNSLSRLDICADFYSFIHCTPQELIRQFLQRKLRRYGKSKYVLHGNQDRLQEYEYLRFGSPTSDVVCYLYNKSLEMREVKHKPYIVRQWSQLTYNYDDVAPAPDVWRLEFRLNGDNIKTLCDDNGELNTLTLNTLNNKTTLLYLYSALVGKFWRWARPTASKFIDCKEVPMFDFDKTQFIVQEQRDERQEVRKCKRFIKQFEEIATDCNLPADTAGILLYQIRAQLPQATKELNAENNSRQIVSFLKHYMQADKVLFLDADAYKDIDLRLKLAYPQAYERARIWAERQGYRNQGDDF